MSSEMVAEREFRRQEVGNRNRQSHKSKLLASFSQAQAQVYSLAEPSHLRWGHKTTDDLSLSQLPLKHGSAS